MQFTHVKGGDSHTDATGRYREHFQKQILTQIHILDITVIKKHM